MLRAININSTREIVYDNDKDEQQAVFTVLESLPVEIKAKVTDKHLDRETGGLKDISSMCVELVKYQVKGVENITNGNGKPLELEFETQGKYEVLSDQSLQALAIPLEKDSRLFTVIDWLGMKLLSLSEVTEEEAKN